MVQDARGLGVEWRMSLLGDWSPMQVSMSCLFAVITLDQCLQDEKSYWQIRVRKSAAVLTTNWGWGAEW
ncbi:hypothetical protein J4Q44_G00087350 [Coregonus suidteri]|uniref:Uncharacterized protein n=1 Tax=Coregonus suidteri TaxID=861788 RepID=A0AAN8M490_9TELE